MVCRPWIGAWSAYSGWIDGCGYRDRDRDRYSMVRVRDRDRYGLGIEIG